MLNTNQLFNLFIALVLLATCSYSVLYYMGMDTRDGITTNFINLILNASILLIGLINLNLRPKIFNSVPVFLFFSLIIYSTIISIGLNSLDEYLPSFLRFISYPITAYFGYSYIKLYGENSFKNKLLLLLKGAIIITIFFGYLEIALGDVQFLNGAYRLSGPFKYHQLGFALFLFVIIVLYKEIQPRTVVNTVILLLLFFLFIGTHSRALIVIIFLCYIVYFFIRIRSVKSVFLFIIFTILILSLVYFVIKFTDLFPRLKDLFDSDVFLNDPSSQERIEIFSDSYQNINGIENLTGIGLGSFNEFYSEFSGREGVAAHNNYLLFYVESGIFGLMIYFLYQIAFTYKLILANRKKNSWILKSAFILFIGVEIFSFLLNNYYFYVSEHLVWLILGAAIFEFGKNNNITNAYDPQ